MSSAMVSVGNIYTAQEIKTKLHNFTNKYRQEKQKIGKSGGSPSTWKLYEAVHQAVGDYKSFCSAELVEDSIEGDMEAIYLEAEIEGESPLPSPDAGPSTSGSSTRPSSNEASKKKKTAVMVMEEMRDYFLKATEAMKEADEKRLDMLQMYVNDVREMKDAFIDFLRRQN